MSAEVGDFFSLLLIVVLFVVLLSRRREAAPAQPAFPPIDASTFLRPFVMMASDKWKPIMLEEPNDAGRRRLVLSIEYTPSSDHGLERLMWTLAASVQRRSRAHVVVVEAFAAGATVVPGSGRARLLFAPDGFGWNGSERSLAQWQLGQQPPQSLDLAQTHGMLASVEAAAS